MDDSPKEELNITENYLDATKVEPSESNAGSTLPNVSPATDASLPTTKVEGKAKSEPSSSSRGPDSDLGQDHTGAASAAGSINAPQSLPAPPSELALISTSGEDQLSADEY